MLLFPFIFQLMFWVVSSYSIFTYSFFGQSLKNDYSNAKFSKEKADLVWSLKLPGLGTLSSPRATDLNQDGIMDIIVGMGRIEFQAADTAIVAIDGKSGEILWKRPAIDQIFGSALLLDINKDEIDDVIIGGRSAILEAIDGATGKLIWEFADNNIRPLIQVKYFNFYNPQTIPVQTGDGIPDIIVSNGGNVLKLPYDEDRPVGRLIVLDASNGNIIQEAEMPDGKETYQSVALSSGEDVNDIQVIFGTGGETIGGSLYVCSLEEVLQGDLSKATKLASSADKGFIAPAVWADLNGDGIEDIIANAVDGTVYAFDGKLKKKLWSVNVPGSEIYSSPAIGYFNKDAFLDVFVTLNSGFWPFFSDCKHIMIDGAKGKIRYQETFGNFQSCSPLVIDINDDGQDEIILSINQEKVNPSGKKEFYNTIRALDFKKTRRKEEFILPLPGHNTSSTPWIGDLDQDHLLDIVFCHSDNIHHTFAYDGMQINLFKTSIEIKKPIPWGSYMGSRYNGRYSER